MYLSSPGTLAALTENTSALPGAPVVAPASTPPAAAPTRRARWAWPTLRLGRAAVAQ